MVKGIDLRSKSILFLPEIITEFKHVVDIEISYNLLVNLPDKIFDLSNLELLDISFNLIE